MYCLSVQGFSSHYADATLSDVVKEVVLEHPSNYFPAFPQSAITKPIFPYKLRFMLINNRF